MIIGRVTGYEIGKNKEGEEDSLLLQVEMTETNDIQTVELFGSGGKDYNPPTDARVVVLSIADAMQIAVAVNDGVTPESEPGEDEIYSVEEYGGPKKARLKCFTDGKLKLNEGGPAAARKEDEIQSTAAEDSAFWAWVIDISARVATLSGTPLTAPTSLTGKITEGSDTVEIGD